MEGFDWSTFALKIYINAPVCEVYKAWSTRATMESWFLREAKFMAPQGTELDAQTTVTAGDTYQWLWYGYCDTVTEHGTITEANGTDSFSFVFGNAGTVTVKLKEVDSLTELILTQSQIPDDEAGRANYHVGCSNGWTFYLANLKSKLEGGLDLRNKNPDLSNVVNA